MGKLYFKFGVMGSAKSSMLLLTAHNFEDRKIPFLCFKPTIDTRDGVGNIHSRAGLNRECIALERETNVYDIISKIIVNCHVMGVAKPQWLLVDESQFLTRQQVDEFAHIVDDFDINVICWGLRTDFQLNLFEGSKRLMELADDIEEIKISCTCGKKAIVNARVDADGRIVTNGEQIMIGGNDMYVPMCRNCYYEAIKNNGINKE